MVLKHVVPVQIQMHCLQLEQMVINLHSFPSLHYPTMSDLALFSFQIVAKCFKSLQMCDNHLRACLIAIVILDSDWILFCRKHQIGIFVLVRYVQKNIIVFEGRKMRFFDYLNEDGIARM